MKPFHFTQNRWFTLVLGATLAWGTLTGTLTAETFEGTLDMALTSVGQKTEATAYLKGLHFKLQPKTALKMDGGVEGYPVVNLETKKVTLMAPKEKYYLDMPIAAMEAALDKAVVPYKKTGRTEVIQGYSAEEFVLDDPKRGITASLWATKELTTAINMLISIQKAVPNEGVVLGRINKDLVAQGYFTLRAEAKDAKGVVTVQMELKAITAKPVADAEFAIPAGWVKMSEYLKKKKGAKP